MTDQQGSTEVATYRLSYLPGLIQNHISVYLDTPQSPEVLPRLQAVADKRLKITRMHGVDEEPVTALHASAQVGGDELATLVDQALQEVLNGVAIGRCYQLEVGRFESWVFTLALSHHLEPRQQRRITRRLRHHWGITRVVWPEQGQEVAVYVRRSGLARSFALRKLTRTLRRVAGMRQVNSALTFAPDWE